MQRIYADGYIPGRDLAISAIHEYLENQRQSGFIHQAGTRSNHSSPQLEAFSTPYYSQYSIVDGSIHESPAWQHSLPDPSPHGLYSRSESTPPERRRLQVYRASRDFQIDEHATSARISSLNTTPPPLIRVPSPSDPHPTFLRLCVNKLLRPRSMNGLWDVKNRKLNLSFDIRKPEGLALMAGEKLKLLPFGIHEQPATIPPCNLMSITHPDFDWPIHVWGGVTTNPEFTPSLFMDKKFKQRHMNYCTVLDVMRTIYEALHVRMSRVEFYEHTPEEQKRTAMAFYQRCRYMTSRPEFGNQEEKGVRRVDLLGIKVQFVGLLPMPEPGKFELVLADRDREFTPHGAPHMDLLLPSSNEPGSAGFWHGAPLDQTDYEKRPGNPRELWMHPPSQEEFSLENIESEPSVQGLGLDLGETL